MFDHYPLARLAHSKGRCLVEAALSVIRYASPAASPFLKKPTGPAGAPRPTRELA